MAKKKAISPEEQRYLAAINEVVDLCREPANLDLIRRFCQVLFFKMDKMERNIVAGAIARDKPGGRFSFPESFLAAEAREAEKRQEATQKRRMTRMLKRPAGREAPPTEMRRAGNEA